MKQTNRDRTYFRRLLEAEQEQLHSRIERLQANGLGEAMSNAVGELSSIDQHTADAGAEMLERERDVGLVARAKEQIARIDDALQRIEAGTYGICAACGNHIPLARLEAMPAATHCIACARQDEEANPPRSGAGDGMEAPFQHAFTSGSGAAGYDGEDTWLDLAEHGTANSPQDEGT